MGHVGLLPQKIKSKKDYKIKGRNLRERKKLVDDIKHLEQAGVFSIVLEATSFDAAEDVLKHSKAPIIGIGASVNCDGQVLVTEDLLGFFDKVPKFVKKYANFASFVSNIRFERRNRLRHRRLFVRRCVRHCRVGAPPARRGRRGAGRAEPAHPQRPGRDVSVGRGRSSGRHRCDRDGAEP